MDTGARTSSLHAVHVSYEKEGDVTIVNFQVHPNQKDARLTVTCRLPVLEFRNVTSSNGKAEKRPVVLTEIELCGEKWPIELTLTNRSQMGFRMLLGREGLRGRFLVDSEKSYYGNKTVLEEGSKT